MRRRRSSCARRRRRSRRRGRCGSRSRASGSTTPTSSARQGLYQDAPPMPSVIGYEVVGRVDALGAGVDGFSPGQRVTALTRFGGYATHALDRRARRGADRRRHGRRRRRGAADAGLHGVLHGRGDGAPASRRPRARARRRRRRRHAAGAALQAPRLRRLRHGRIGRQARPAARARRRSRDQLPQRRFRRRGAPPARRAPAST